jgi:dienelactone hydrolase
MKKAALIIIFGTFLFAHNLSLSNTVEIEKRIDTLYKWFEKMGNPATVGQAISKAKRYEPKDYENNSKEYSAVIFLHGCSGITREEVSWARLLSDNGYYVILPDSFARDKRRMNCNPSDPKWKEGGFLNAFAYRQEEIAAAYLDLQGNKKIDKKNIFLIGFSEGGIATAQTIQKGLKGQVILGWTCSLKGQPNFEGINQLEEIPVIAIAATSDPWRIGTTNTGRCADSLHVNKSFKQVDIDGAFHDLFHNQASRDAVLKFLSEYSIGR